MSEAAKPTLGEPVSRSVASALSSRWGRIVIYILVFLWTIPTFGLVATSLRPGGEVARSGWWHIFSKPKFTLENYTEIFRSANGETIWVFLLNSIKITVPAVLISIAMAAFLSYALSWMKIPGRDWIFTAVVALLVVPLQMSLIPLSALFNNGAHIGTTTIFPNIAHGVQVTLPGLDWTVPVVPALSNSVTSLWIAHTIFGLPLCVFILRNFISGLPSELIEAAQVDGASHMTIFTRLVVPLSVPAIASLGIFQFIYIWNDLLVALVFAGSTKPINQALVEMTGTWGSKWQLLTSAAFVSMVVPLAVFFSLQRFFVRGLLAGAVKG